MSLQLGDVCSLAVTSLIYCKIPLSSGLAGEDNFSLPPLLPWSVSPLAHTLSAKVQELPGSKEDKGPKGWTTEWWEVSTLPQPATWLRPCGM